MDSKDGISKHLTPRQARFVEEYLVDLNATQAAIRASYSRKTANEQGARLLANVSIRTAIEAAQAARAKRTEITQDVVLQELALLLRSDVRNFQVDVGTGALILSDGAPDNAWRAVSSVKHRRTVTGRGDDLETTYEIEYRLWDKPAAVKMAGQHLAMFTEKHEHSGPGGGPIEVNTDELRNRLAGRVAGIASRMGTGQDHSGTNGNGAHRA